MSTGASLTKLAY